MPSWNELLDTLNGLPPEQRNAWIREQQIRSLQSIAQRRGNRNVIYYGSSFLQKPQVPPMMLQITHEEINGFMSVMYGMQWDRGLTLVLHSPGGITNATETLVSYLTSKFDYIEVIIPTFAISAGTMISLASNLIIMGRQSQLGPIDPQMPFGNRFVSAQAIVDQFERAKGEILSNVQLAHAWAPILQSIGPAALQEAQNALDYGERMVARWLAQRMFASAQNPTEVAQRTARFFNDASQHLSHGRRIDREEARTQGLTIQELEEDQELQDAVLTAYHLMTLVFEHGPAAKFIHSNHDRMWVKNWAPSPPPQAPLIIRPQR